MTMVQCSSVVDCIQLDAVHGVELDVEAYAQTHENYELSPWRKKMKAVHSSFQQYSSQFSSTESTGSYTLKRIHSFLPH